MSDSSLAGLAAAVLVLVAGVGYVWASGEEARALPPAVSVEDNLPAPVRKIIISTGQPSAKPTPTATEAPATKAAVRVRIMPLGDSITYGLGTDDLGSYRPALAGELAAAGVAVDFVGSMQSGPAGTDRDNEGHIGWRIEKIAEHADEWMTTYRPDIVLLHIGTNDMRNDEKAVGAPERLSALIDRLLAAAPTAHIVVAELIGSDDAAFHGKIQRRIDAFNKRIPGIVSAKGRRAHLADQHRVDGDLMDDAFHPNERGYHKMAANWFQALQKH